MPLLFLSHVLYSALVDRPIFKGEQICFFEFHIAHSERLLTACDNQLLYNSDLIMFGMCKTKHSCKDCKRCLFIVSKIDII